MSRLSSYTGKVCCWPSDGVHQHLSDGGAQTQSHKRLLHLICCSTQCFGSTRLKPWACNQCSGKESEIGYHIGICNPASISSTNWVLFFPSLLTCVSWVKDLKMLRDPNVAAVSACCKHRKQPAVSKCAFSSHTMCVLETLFSPESEGPVQDSYSVAFLWRD